MIATVIHCTRCNDRLRGKVVWLELNNRTNTYHRTEDHVPASESQGWFPFGAACATSIEREQRERRVAS